MRWWIFVYMFLFIVLSFVQRTSLGIATDAVKAHLHLSQFQVFMLMAAFMVVYTALQMPAGAFGQRFGARRTFVLVGGLGCLATVATPLAPLVFDGTPVLIAMVLAQILLGISQAPVFPVSTGVFESWFPSSRWGFVNGLSTSGLHVGTAVTAPLIVALTASLGWQRGLLYTAVPVMLLTVCWAWYGRDIPQEHPAVSAEELAEIDAGGHEPPAPTTLRRCLQLIGDRNMLTLAVSYMWMNIAVYLLLVAPFLYLTQYRHMSQADSGWLAMLPPAGAAVGAWLGGMLTDRLVARFGLRWGHRLVPLVSLPAAAVMLLWGAQASSVAAALAFFVLGYALVEVNEGPVAAAATQIARADTMSGWGIINTGGNLAGVVLYPLFGYLSGRGDWNSLFAIAAGCCLISAALWLRVCADQRFAPKVAAAGPIQGRSQVAA